MAAVSPGAAPAQLTFQQAALAEVGDGNSMTVDHQLLLTAISIGFTSSLLIEHMRSFCWKKSKRAVKEHLHMSRV
jgi:hypothetical protein